MTRSTLLLLLPWAGCASSLDATGLEGHPFAARVLDPGCAGSPYATIQAAIDAAADGDVISVCSGTYRERLTIAGKRLTLQSSGGALVTTIDAQTFGTALSVTGGADVTVDGLTFTNGNAANLGGNVYCIASDLAMTNSRVVAGNAGNGAGLGATACTGTVTATAFENNDSAWFGGGIATFGDGLAVEGNTFVANHAVQAGGGLYLAGSSPIRDNTFDGNSSDFYGGGAHVESGFGDISGNDVENNTSLNDGAGIYVSGGSPIVEGNTFVGNVSDDEAGGLRLKSSTGSVIDNVFTGNHADYRGGAMKVSHEEITMTGNTFTGNSAWVSAGAVYLEESSSLLADNTFVDNSAEHGGALYVAAGWDGVVIEDSTFEANDANDEGGAIYVDLVGHTTTLRRVVLRTGEADLGAGIYANGADLVLVNVVFDRNTASVAGGGLYLDTTTGSMTNAVLWQNDAPSGAGLGVVNGAAFTVANTAFARNLTGASVSLSSGTAPTIRYSAFNQNTRNFSGLPGVLGVDGNRNLAPRFVRPVNGNFRLSAGSRLIDAGDPAILDLNGTRSDIGMYGGPSAP